MTTTPSHSVKLALYMAMVAAFLHGRKDPNRPTVPLVAA